MVGLLLVVEMSRAGDVRGMAVSFGPIDRLLLTFERREDAVAMILDHEVFNAAALRPILRPRLDKNNRHLFVSSLFPPGRRDLWRTPSIRKITDRGKKLLFTPTSPQPSRSLERNDSDVRRLKFSVVSGAIAMRRSGWTPSIVPRDDDQSVYIVRLRAERSSLP
jgi:hypothetical protein